MRGGGGGKHLIFRRTKGGGQSVVTEHPKGRSLERLDGLRRGTTQICLENEDMGGWGLRESHQKLLGGSAKFPLV